MQRDSPEEMLKYYTQKKINKRKKLGKNEVGAYSPQA